MTVAPADGNDISVFSQDIGKVVFLRLVTLKSAENCFEKVSNDYHKILHPGGGLITAVGDPSHSYTLPYCPFINNGLRLTTTPCRQSSFPFSLAVTKWPNMPP